MSWGLKHPFILMLSPRVIMTVFFSNVSLHNILCQDPGWSPHPANRDFKLASEQTRWNLHSSLERYYAHYDYIMWEVPSIKNEVRRKLAKLLGRTTCMGKVMISVLLWQVQNHQKIYTLSHRISVQESLQNWLCLFLEFGTRPPHFTNEASGF